MPRSVRVLGWLLFPGAFMIGSRFLWEETFLTWERGPQMVGFSILHTGGPLVLVALLCLLLLQIWLVLAVVILVWGAVRGRRPTRGDVTQLVVVGATLALFMVPYPFWQWVGVRLYGPGAHAGSYLVGAAAQGDVRLVNELLGKSVPVDAREPNGSTALSGAAVGGQLRMVQLLLERGADVNSINGVLGRTALMNAAEMGHVDVARYLLARGADPELRDANGQTAREIAVSNRRSDVAAVLGDAKAQ